VTGPSVRDLVARSVAFARSYRRQARHEASPQRVAVLRGEAAHCMRLARHLRRAGIIYRSYP
jgi:hypothetical protein